MNNLENLDKAVIENRHTDLQCDPNLGKAIVAELRKLMADFLSSQGPSSPKP